MMLQMCQNITLLVHTMFLHVICAALPKTLAGAGNLKVLAQAVLQAFLLKLC